MRPREAGPVRFTNRWWHLFFAVAAFLPAAASIGGADQHVAVRQPGAAELAQRAWAVLDDVLAREEGWVRIHAAETLLALGDRRRIRELLESELASYERSAFRVGAWRVLAASARTPAERARWIGRIEAAFLDPAGEDRLQAIETMAKLGHRISGPTLSSAWEMVEAVPESAGLFPLWALCLAGEPQARTRLLLSLESEDPEVRRRTAYVLRRMESLDGDFAKALVRAAERESADTVAYPYLLGAALWFDLAPERAGSWQAELERGALVTARAAVRFEVFQVLMRRYSVDDLPRMIIMLDEPEAPVRIGTAWTLLSVLGESRAP